MIQGNSILVVDDCEEVRSLLYDLFTMMRLKVYCAAGGNEAVDVCDTHSIHLVITDIEMEEGGGLELLDRLAADTDIPVIVVSGKEEYRQESINRGAFNFYHKPFNVGVLKDDVKRLLAVDNYKARREHIRYHREFDLKLVAKKTDKEYRARSVNVSLAGLCLESERLNRDIEREFSVEVLLGDHSCRIGDIEILWEQVRSETALTSVRETLASYGGRLLRTSEDWHQIINQNG